MKPNVPNTFKLPRTKIVVNDETVPLLAQDLEASEQRLGQGVSRFAYGLSDDFVLKVARLTHHHEINLAEAALWAAVEDTDAARFFAPIHALSPSGQWIVMTRVKHTYNDLHDLADPPPYTQNPVIRDRANAHVNQALAALAKIHPDLYVSDTHHGNIGETADGEFKWMDYAENNALHILEGR
jgi:hypothetical protein